MLIESGGLVKRPDGGGSLFSAFDHFDCVFDCRFIMAAFQTAKKLIESRQGFFGLCLAKGIYAHPKNAKRSLILFLFEDFAKSGDRLLPILNIAGFQNLGPLVVIFPIEI